MAEERLYRLEPLDTTGVFLGLGVVQIGLLGGGIVLAVAMVSAGLPVLAAAVPVVAAGAVSFVRAGGHQLWEWLPLAAGWLWAGVGRGRRWAPPLPLWPTDSDGPAPLPPCLEGLQIIEVGWHDDRVLGAVFDRQRRTLTAVVPVTAAQFLLEGDDEQARLVAGWGELLSQHAHDASPVAYIAWTDLVRPAGLGHLAVPTRGADCRDAAASYGELLDVASATGTAHDVVVSVTVAAERLRGRGAGTLQERLGAALAGSTESLFRGLGATGLDAGRPLDAVGLQRLLRLHVDPCGARRRRTSGRLVDRLGLVSAASAGPLVLETGWRHVRADGAWHRTWWVAWWPRLPVPAAWLEPFLSPGGVARTMTVVAAPVSTYRSRRRIEQDLVKLESTAATRQERGRRVDARHQRATQALLEREQELVAGFAEMVYLGLVSIAAASEDELEEHAEIVEQHAHEVGMELRVLHGRQDLAWAAALPLGLAPRSVLAT